MTALVTGGNGFIGSAVAKALRASFSEIRIGTRRPVEVGESTSGDTRSRYVACDLERPQEIRRAVAGVDVVLHTAYSASAAETEAQCRRLLDALGAENVSSVVHLSSIAVYGDREGRVGESDVAASSTSPYASSKIACEAMVRAWTSDPGTSDRRAIVLRPGIVYGTGSPFWIEKLTDRIVSGAWGTFGPAGEGYAALVHVDDVCEVLVSASTALAAPSRGDLPPFAAVNVVGPEQVTWNDYFAALAGALGHAPLPELGAASVARRQAVAVAAKIWGRLGLPGGHVATLAPTPGEMEVFHLKATYASDSLEQLLGTRPRITLREGLARSELPKRRGV